MFEADPRTAAAAYFRQAYEQQMAGEYQQAIEFYNRAIAECLEAIKVDPEFGNPYNDIGAYLIEQGKWEEAIPWLAKATRAKRYEARCYPHFNLGRAYEHKHDWEKAKECYAQAYALEERYLVALAALRRLRAMFN